MAKNVFILLSRFEGGFVCAYVPRTHNEEIGVALHLIYQKLRFTGSLELFNS
jgi:hypothetical protein